MIVSNKNSLLNILIPNDNKALKEVLKEADIKTLLGSTAKELTVPNIIKNLFNSVLDGSKSSQTIKNLLQNSNVLKELGSFTSSVQNLLKTLPSDEKFSEIKSFLKNFLVKIENVDEKNLKQQILKSGIFLESKLNNIAKPNKSLQNILKEIKEVIKDFKTPLSKEISTLVDKLATNLKTNENKDARGLNTTSDTKAEVNKLQSLLKTLLSSSLKQETNTSTKVNNLLNQLQNLNTKSSTIDKSISSFQNMAVKTQITQNASQILSSLKNELSKEINNNTRITPIPISISTPNSNPSPNTPDTKLNLNSNSNSIAQNANIAKDINIPVANNIATSLSNNKSIINEIDSLIKNNSLFLKNDKMIEPKNVLNKILELISPQNKVAQEQNTNTNIDKSINNLQNILKQINTSENSLLNNKTLQTPISETIKDLHTNLKLLKENLPTNTSFKSINTLIDKLLNITNLFSKIPMNSQALNSPIQENNQSLVFTNFTNNINSIITSLRSTAEQNNNILQEKNISTLINKLQNILNTKVPGSKDTQPSLQNDIKANLLQVQAELLQSGSSAESLRHIDKLLTQIDYYQLLSINNNSNSVYLPFLWDLLEDGSISLKQTKEKKFFCEINLTLKEFGKVNLLLSLYDDDHLDISAFASNNNFNTLVKDNIQDLRKALTRAGLKPINIKIVDLEKKSNPKETKQVNQYIKNNDNLGFRIDIRV